MACRFVEPWGISSENLFLSPRCYQAPQDVLGNTLTSDELLDGEIFDTLLEAKVLIERWRVRYNTVRPHVSVR